MLSDPFGRRIIPGLDGWHSFALIPASRAAERTGLEEIAAYVAAGTMPADTPIFLATKRTDAPWPDVLVAVPLTLEELTAWRDGDGSVVKDVVEALEEAYGSLMRAAKANQVN